MEWKRRKSTEGKEERNCYHVASSINSSSDLDFLIISRALNHQSGVWLNFFFKIFFYNFRYVMGKFSLKSSQSGFLHLWLMACTGLEESCLFQGIYVIYSKIKSMIYMYKPEAKKFLNLSLASSLFPKSITIIHF